MDISYLLTSIVAESIGKTSDKLNFKKNKINPRQMLMITFFMMTACIAGYILLTGQSFPRLSVVSAGLLVGIALFSFGGNVFDEISLQKTDLSVREPLVNLEPIATGLLAYMLFPEERDPAILVAFALGAMIVHWGINSRRLHTSQQKGIIYLWIAVAVYAIVPVFYKQALVYISPEYIALFRISSILILLSIFFRPKRRSGLTGSMLTYGVFSGFAYTVGAVASLYAIQQYGLVLTMLFLMLGPALRYLASQFILREKVQRRQVLSSLMLTLVVAITAFVK